LQVEQDACLNGDQRDCKWMDSVKGMVLGGKSGASSQESVSSNPSVGDSGDASNNPTAITGQAIFDGADVEAEVGEAATNRPDGICVPRYAPGLKFWEKGSAQQICRQASAKCVVVYEKKLYKGKKKIVEGKECLEEAWAASANGVCSALGDCGGAVNYNGEYTDDGYKWIDDGDERWLL